MFFTGFIFSAVYVVVISQVFPFFVFFFFNDTATTEIYTLSLHDALPISRRPTCPRRRCPPRRGPGPPPDRKSTRLNSSHVAISYAVFCLKKKRNTQSHLTLTKKKKKKKKNTQKQTT